MSSIAGTSGNLLGKTSLCSGLVQPSVANNGPAVSKVVACGGPRAAVARIRGGGEAAAAACIGGDAGHAAAVVEEVREREKPPTAEPELVESPRGQPGATAVCIGGESALEKGEAVVVGGELVESSSRQIFRHANKVAVPKGRKKVMKKVLPELPNGKKILTEAGLANIVWCRNKGGEPLLSPTVHEADVYSKHPKDLVEEFHWSAFMMNGHGQEYRVWLFIGKKPLSRNVGGSNSDKWHAQTGEKRIRDANGEFISWARKRNLSYMINCAPKIRGQSTGWVMVEYWLTNEEEDTDWICVVYQSNRSYPETPTADSSSPGAETPSIEQAHDEAEEEDGASVDASPGSGSDRPSPSICVGSTTELLLQVADKATSCGDYKKACEINEFVLVEEEFLRTIDELGLNSSIISESWDKLKILLQNAAITEELTSKARDKIVSCCEHISTIIHSALSDERVKRERQENNALRRIGVNVRDQVSKRASQVIDVPLLVRDNAGSERVHYQAPAEDGVLSIGEGAENEGPIHANTSPASSSAIKRKADQDHPEAPPSTRQERTDMDTDGQEGTNQMSFSENVPMPAGVDCVWDLARGVTIGVPQVQPEQQRLAQGAEGCSGPCNALDDLEAPPSTNQERAVTENEPMTMENEVVVDLPASASEVQSEQQGLTPGRSVLQIALDNIHDRLLSDTNTMDIGGDNVGDPVEPWASVLLGGEQAMPESTPGAVTEVDAAQGSRTGFDCPEQTEHQLSQDKNLPAVVDPGDFLLMEEFPGQFEAEKYIQTPMCFASTSEG